MPREARGRQARRPAQHRYNGMTMLKSKRVISALVVMLVLIVLGIAVVNDCSSIGGMGWSVVKCECSGIERVLYDRTAGDGPMRTICIGLVRSRECFQYVDGPKVPCSP